MEARNMFLHIAANRVIGDIQKEFTNMFPFLRLEFYRADEKNVMNPKRFLPEKFIISNAGKGHQRGDILVKGDMTVSQLEQEFLSAFGLGVQVQRKSGKMWLETTMTDNWTLQKQNELGKEISQPQ